jgi:hypothetical protein
MQMNAGNFFEERNEIKANPMLKTLRTTRFFALCVIITYLVVLVGSFLLFIEGRQSTMSLPPHWVPIAVITAFTLTTNCAQERYWKRIEQQRFALLFGELLSHCGRFFPHYHIPCNFRCASSVGEGNSEWYYCL